MSEHQANKGYVAFRKETTKGTPAGVPNVYGMYYEDSLVTNPNLDEDTPIMGNLFARYRSLLGLRSHGGDMKILAEPNTAGHLLNMILTKGSDPGGSSPYTHPFTLSPTTNPKSYTMDVQKGNVVMRFAGVEISELGIDFDKNKMVFSTKMHALKSFIVREVASVSGSGTYTIVLKTNYDPSPTGLLQVGDIMTVLKADGTTIDFEVDSVAGATSLTCSEDVSTIADGDLVYIRAATPSWALKAPFMWALTEFRFAGSASSALSATQTRVEQGSRWNLMYKFESDEGAQRSGSFDPAALVRTLGDIEIPVKVAFDTPTDINRYLTSGGRALVIRHFSEDQAYELRVTINNFKIKEHPVPSKTKEVLYAEEVLIPDYNTSDGQSWDIKVISNLSTY